MDLIFPDCKKQLVAPVRRISVKRVARYFYFKDRLSTVS